MIYEASVQPPKAGVYRTAGGVYRLWDGKTWHRGARSPDVAAARNEPISKSLWVDWVGPDTLEPAEANGTGVLLSVIEAAETFTKNGANLIALGEALRDPTTTLGALHSNAKQAGMKFTISFERADDGPKG